MKKIAPFEDDPEMVMTMLAPVINAYDAHSDVPWPGLFQQILKSYPDSRFVFIKRDPVEWWNSLARHWKLNIVKRYLTTYEYIQYRNYINLPRRHLVSLADGPLFQSALLKHTALATNAIPTSQLLIVDLDDPAISEKLCQFLGLETRIPFPSITNKSSLKPRRKFAYRLVRRVAHFFGLR